MMIKGCNKIQWKSDVCSMVNYNRRNKKRKNLYWFKRAFNRCPHLTFYLTKYVFCRILDKSSLYIVTKRGFLYTEKSVQRTYISNSNNQLSIKREIIFHPLCVLICILRKVSELIKNVGNIYTCNLCAKLSRITFFVLFSLFIFCMIEGLFQALHVISNR